ncbi:MAG: acyl-CoA dehydrogenase family protein, partial [Brevibacterium aurantiacum]
EVADLPGFSRGRVLDKVGQRGQDTRELFFEDMRVPVDNVLGGVEGRGFIQLMQQLPQERMAIAVAGATTAEAAVREAVAYAKEREAFGQPIMKFQNTKFVLAECATEVFSTRTFVDHLTQLHIDGKLTTEQASAGKYWATDAQTNVIDRCLQVFGGYGYMMEYPIARMYADARVQKIYGGTNEIMKELISRGL